MIALRHKNIPQAYVQEYNRIYKKVHIAKGVTFDPNLPIEDLTDKYDIERAKRI